MHKTHGIPALLLLFSPIVANPAGAGEAGRYPWQTDLDPARELSAAEGKPMLIVFRCEP